MSDELKKMIHEARIKTEQQPLVGSVVLPTNLAEAMIHENLDLLKSLRAIREIASDSNHENCAIERIGLIAHKAIVDFENT